MNFRFLHDTQTTCLDWPYTKVDWPHTSIDKKSKKRKNLTQKAGLVTGNYQVTQKATSLVRFSDWSLLPNPTLPYGP